MADFKQEKQDQSIEESTAMTIEFLRARLLSERSVSKSARQRADELEKRVEELQEQLSIVSLQRKMAEKATVDVLSILESRGISDTAEAFDSGSEQGTHQESHEGNEYPNGEEHSVVSKRSELEEFSGSDLDSSSINSKNLSWKGRTGSEWSREKNRNLSMRRHNGVSLVGSSSPKHYLGKSCRQNRRRDTRMVLEENKTVPPKFDSQINGVASLAQLVPECSDSTQKIVREDSGSVANGRNITNHLDVNGHLLEKDMEKALEDQAQLIGQYEEMEKAQREWEEKFRENSNNIPDSYSPGNHSHVTEERDKAKAQTPSNMGMDNSENEEAKADKVNVSKESPKPHANGFVPPSHGDIRALMDQTSTSFSTVAPPRSQSQVLVFPKAIEKEAQESVQNHHFRPPQNLDHSQLLLGPIGNQSLERPSSETGSSSQKGDYSGSQKDMYALVPHNTQNALGSVLDALNQAKLQLHNKKNRAQLEVTPTSSHKAIRALPCATTSIGERAEISVGCSGLFRLPTDFAVEEAHKQANFLGSRSSLPPSPYYTDYGTAVSTPERFPASPYVERRSGFTPNDHFLSSSSVVSGSRASSSSNPRIDPYVDTSLSSVNRYNHYSRHQPSYPPFPAAMRVMSRIPSDEGFRRNFPNTGTAFREPEDQMFYSDYARPNNIYR